LIGNYLEGNDHLHDMIKQLLPRRVLHSFVEMKGIKYVIHHR
jgi:hypothetical protein